MLKWAAVASARVGDSELVLAKHDNDWVVRVDQRVLMSNRAHQSEISLAEEGLKRCRSPQPQCVLVGGLGLGYTLRATLDLLPQTAKVVVAELVPELVEWNKSLLTELNNNPCADPRCEIVAEDVYEVLLRSKAKFDVILLDVDNGPRALAQAKNQRLYSDKGTRVCWDALKPNGVLVVWSAGPNAKYAARLHQHGFASEVLRVPVRLGGRATHVLFVGKKQNGHSPPKPDQPRRPDSKSKRPTTAGKPRRR